MYGTHPHQGIGFHNLQQRPELWSRGRLRLLNSLATLVIDGNLHVVHGAHERVRQNIYEKVVSRCAEIRQQRKVSNRAKNRAQSYRLDALVLNFGDAAQAYICRHGLGSVQQEYSAQDSIQSTASVAVPDVYTSASFGSTDVVKRIDAVSTFTDAETRDMHPSVLLKIYTIFLTYILDPDPYTGDFKDLEVRKYQAPAQYMSTAESAIPIALSPCGTWRNLDVCTDSPTPLWGVTYIVACHKVHISQLLSDVMMQRHKVPRAILEPQARTQKDNCLYVWVLCGTRRYTQDERTLMGPSYKEFDLQSRIRTVDHGDLGSDAGDSDPFK